MGLFDKIFTRKEDIAPVTVETPVELSNKIQSILLVLSNLSLMKKDDIRDKIADDDYYDESILSKMTIKELEDIPYLEKYYGKAKFGYGSCKIEKIKTKLENYVTDKLLSNVPNDEIVEGLIVQVEPDINKYKNILIKFNDSLRQIEDNSTDYSEMTYMIDEWKKYYKEQELGYPVNLEEKIEDLSKSLRDLPYNGYGEEEIGKFREAAKKMIEEAKLNNEEAVHTYNRMHAELYTPMKNRFLADVDTLKRKLQMIDESPYISDFEKEQNKQKTIKEFNKLNGHHIEEGNTLEQMKKNLTLLEYGGYGEEIINKFTKKAETIISDGERIKKPKAEVQKDIQAEYQKLLDNYQVKLDEMKARIAEAEANSSSEKERDQKKAIILEDFHDEMGMPIDFKERINAMILELKNLDRGGYGELKIDEFKTKSLERLSSANTRTEIRDALKEIREVQERMISEYTEELRKLYDASDRVSHDRHLSDQEKQRAVEEFDREFKFKMGYRMNFEKYIDNRAEELRSLSGGGYGKEAVDEFVNEAKVIAESAREEKEKYDLIHQKFTAYKKQYNTNLKTFKEWKRIQLIGEDNKEELEQELNSKIAYMLSLSPKELQNYYLEDDKRRKEETDNHNYLAAYKFLARQEAKYKNDESIFEQRIQELESGKNVYTKDEIEEATSELKLLSLTDNHLPEDEKLISLVEYIDSTLLRQMMYVEAKLMKANQ